MICESHAPAAADECPPRPPGHALPAANSPPNLQCFTRRSSGSACVAIPVSLAVQLSISPASSRQDFFISRHECIARDHSIHSLTHSHSSFALVLTGLTTALLRMSTCLLPYIPDAESCLSFVPPPLQGLAATSDFTPLFRHSFSGLLSRPR